ncbi:hypothetical protein CERZMDRAFT_103310 [Cercospora zeae-maydis SCOH1-5]|uniref:Uncharacterized protein n=1 Tax=Cercospora zeae-maydis SCOH1-5 TaxID=717836 RepID=A0A6A6EZ99_9PEZI|nr:hypothetical protein CERZMDRAFT_103310 [Cercospora zeae-maydis SCOH1-5]
MPNLNTGEINPRLEPTGPGPVDNSTSPISPPPRTNSPPRINPYGPDRLTSATGQKIPAGDVGSNKETEGGRENQEMTRKTRSSKNNAEGKDTAAKK